MGRHSLLGACTDGKAWCRNDRSSREVGAGAPRFIRDRCIYPILPCKRILLRAGFMKFASLAGNRLLFYCAFGERSAMTVQAAQDAGFASACHIEGGINMWRERWAAPTAFLNRCAAQ